MKEKVLNKNSWHFRIATLYGGNFWLSDYNRTDFCSYLRCIRNGLLNIGLIIIFGGVMGALTGDFLALVLAMITSNSFIYPGPLSIGFLFFAFIFFIIAFFVILGDYVEDRINEKRLAREFHRDELPKESFWSLLKKSIREKVCFKITFKD